MFRRFISILIFLCFIIHASFAQQWSMNKANKWYKKQPWLVGCNYTPAYAINQLEFWQAETFNLKAIDKELGWAQSLGFNTLRVFLHDLAWKQDPSGFKKRIDSFLTVCKKHGIMPMFVFFDDCWGSHAKPGPQPAPQPGVHNSGWLRSPNRAVHNDSALWVYLKAYVQDILTSFKKDKRILLWDLYNEPGNFGYELSSFPLVKNVFAWAREVNPSQPLTMGVYDYFSEMAQWGLDHSDVISYHSYSVPALHQQRIDSMKQFHRPVFCTEYMARPLGCTFENTMPMLKAQKIAAINWGFVDGKTQTKYQWGKVIGDGSDPELWFHDILRSDGAPYKEAEVQFIKEMTKTE